MSKRWRERARMAQPMSGLWAGLGLCFVVGGLTGCDDGGSASPEPDAEVIADMAVVDMGPHIPTIDERCPEAQAGTYLLVLYPDRVEAWRQRTFNATYLCDFLDLKSNGITNATAIVRGRTGDKHFYVTVPEADGGAVHAFDEGGAYVGKVMNNINLQGVSGIWPTTGEDYVAYSATSQNLYRLNADFQFRGPASLPQLAGAQVAGLVDLAYYEDDAIIALYGDRPPQLYKDPFAPSWPATELGAGGAVALIDAEEGIKVLMAGPLGNGNRAGVTLYKPIFSGRNPPEREQVLVTAGEMEDPNGLVIIDTGFFVLDRGAGAGAGHIHGFNGIGVRQSDIELQGDDKPLRLLRESIFSRF